MNGKKNEVTGKLYMIAAMSENRVIGQGDHLPWHLPDEWKHFRKVTEGRAFIMGRKSYEAPDALHSDRKNVVISSKEGEPSGNTIYVKDISHALALLSDEKEVFILGGASVFLQTIDLVDKLYLTIVHAQIEGDAFFPLVDPNEWELETSEYHGIDDQHEYAFSMNVYKRKAAG